MAKKAVTTIHQFPYFADYIAFTGYHAFRGALESIWGPLLFIGQGRKQIMKKPRRTGMAQNPIVNARGRTIPRESESKTALLNRRPCLSCQKNFSQIRPKQKFCSNRCRLLYWAAREIIREYSAGNAAGLREMIEKIRS